MLRQDSLGLTLIETLWDSLTDKPEELMPGLGDQFLEASNCLGFLANRIVQG
jgi:hypothetical protein